MEAVSTAAASTTLRQVAQRRILFGHQSVGGNILEGLRQLGSEQQAAGLRIVAADQPLDSPALAHLAIGENGKPASKIADFDRLLAGEPGGWAEVAFFKFCYADFDARTDARHLFESYQRANEARRARHPRITFMHLTAPLTTVQRGPAGWVLRLAGRDPWGEPENVIRHQYNELLRQTYRGREPILDLARLESAGGNGSFRHRGRRYESLSPGYTDDGGHLNYAGRLAVATAAIATLAALPATAG
jgi:hypothetical protein